MYHIISDIVFLLTGFEQNILERSLKMKNGEQLGNIDQNFIFIQKYRYFDLKVALFVEKRKNKFAYELKKNKFVFN